MGNSSLQDQHAKTRAASFASTNENFWLHEFWYHGVYDANNTPDAIGTGQYTNHFTKYFSRFQKAHETFKMLAKPGPSGDSAFPGMLHKQGSDTHICLSKDLTKVLRCA